MTLCRALRNESIAGLRSIPLTPADRSPRAGMGAGVGDTGVSLGTSRELGVPTGFPRHRGIAQEILFSAFRTRTLGTDRTANGTLFADHLLCDLGKVTGPCQTLVLGRHCMMARLQWAALRGAWRTYAKRLRRGSWQLSRSPPIPAPWPTFPCPVPGGPGGASGHRLYIPSQA